MMLPLGNLSQCTPLSEILAAPFHHDTFEFFCAARKKRLTSARQRGVRFAPIARNALPAGPQTH